MHFISNMPTFIAVLFSCSDSVQGLKHVVKLNGSKEGAEHLTEKMMKAFQYVYRNHHNDYDWVLKGDDDTYFIPENLRLLLSQYSSEEPIYFGHTLELRTNDRSKELDADALMYMSGGAGYVMSREALRRLVVLGIDVKVPCWTSGGAEDVAVGRCMTDVGVITGDSTDVKGRETFHPFSLQSHLSNSYPEWYIKYKTTALVSTYKT